MCNHWLRLSHAIASYTSKCDHWTPQDRTTKRNQSPSSSPAIGHYLRLPAIANLCQTASQPVSLPTVFFLQLRYVYPRLSLLPTNTTSCNLNRLVYIRFYLHLSNLYNWHPTFRRPTRPAYLKGMSNPDSDHQENFFQLTSNAATQTTLTRLTTKTQSATDHHTLFKLDELNLVITFWTKLHNSALNQLNQDPSL